MTTETPAPVEYTVEPYANGMENWTGSPNKTDEYPKVTQILFCVDPWDNEFFKNSAGKNVTVTMEAEGKEAATFTLPIATVYAGGSWGILRVEPCLMDTPWVPEKDVEYKATLTFEAPDGTVVRVVSDGVYKLDVDPVVPEPAEPTEPTVPTEPTEEPTGDNTAIFAALAILAVLGTAVVVSKKVFSK